METKVARKAIVDIGSNGIRFSVTDLSEPNARNLPTLVFERVSISVYDAQFRDGSDERHPIPDEIIQSIVDNLLRWQRVCDELDVTGEDMAIVATEATRTAPNVDQLRDAIEKQTLWKLTCLAKEEESVYGVYGIASSRSSAAGLVMDLGGGSVQLNWIIASDGHCETSHDTAQSLPYGAATLTKRLAREARASVSSEVVRNLRSAYEALKIPKHVGDQITSDEGVTLYLSGGGFRGWGHILMHLRKKSTNAEYPIPLINGFHVTGNEFFDTRKVSRIGDYRNVFRISKRRAEQVPAISLLVESLYNVLPRIKEVHFCQGGIREGKLFKDLPVEIRSNSPVVAATTLYADARTKVIFHLLERASRLEWWPEQITQRHVLAFVSLMFHHHPVNKDARAAAALRSTTAGLLAGTLGLSHDDRTILALLLAERWDAELDPDNKFFYQELQDTVGSKVAWWCKYMGQLAHLLGVIYPTAFFDHTTPRVHLSADVSHMLGSSGRKTGIKLRIELQSDSPLMRPAHVFKLAHDIRKVGKKKNWIKGYGKKIDVEVTKIGPK